MSKNKEVELYEVFFPVANGEGSSHAQQHNVPAPTPPKCTLCGDTRDLCDCFDNDSNGG